MGMDAMVICIGKYKSDLKNYLDYDSSYYVNMKECDYVVSTVLHCRTLNSSKELASILGLDPWDFSTHQINIKKINWEKLEEFVLRDTDIRDDKIDMDIRDDNILKNLLENDYICMYCPNG